MSKKKKIALIIGIVILLIICTIIMICFSLRKDSYIYETNSNVIENQNITNKLENLVTNEIANDLVRNNIVETQQEEDITTTENSSQTTKTTNNKNNSSENKNQTSQKQENKQETIKEETTTQETPTNPTTPNINDSEKPVEKPPEETKPIEEKCTTNSNHGIGVGNSGKWFNTKESAIKEYNSKISYWGEKWENFEIDDNTYYTNCPSGYEVYSCPYCGKWTINYYYR